jgi:hypothetical protein
VHLFGMVLQISFAVQDDIATGMGARDRLAVRIVAEMLAIEVCFMRSP